MSTTPSPNLAQGKWAEQIASAYLAQQGMTILATNYRSLSGEIDIIAKENDILVLVEVKNRKATQKDWLPDAVPPRKIKRILKTAEKYIEENKVIFKEMRVDVIWLIRNKTSYQLIHHRDFA
jgi:putative endonuclease